MSESPSPAAEPAAPRLLPEPAAGLSERHALIRSWPAPALLASRQGTLLAWNEDAARLLGVPPEKALDLRVVFDVETAEALLGAGGDAVEVRCAPSGGADRTVLARARALDDGHVLIALGDVAREERLRAHIEQAERLASVGELLSSVAHELNNPLTSVLGYAEILLAEDSDNLPREELRFIHSEATRCRRIAENLLDLSRCETLAMRPILLQEVVRKVVDFRSYSAQATGIELLCEIEPGLPFVMGDFHRLVQAVLNLVTNAEYAVAARASGPRIVLRAQRAGGTLALEVEDNGTGVAPELAESIFEPFFTTKPRGRGTGLGLSLVRATARSHGGAIRVERAGTGGARFVLELPFATDGAA